MLSAFEETDLRRSFFALTSLLAFGVAAPAFAQAGSSQTPGIQAPAVPQASDSGAHDPWEKLNRFFFVGNAVVDKVALRPVSIFYKRVTPRPARDGVHNVIDNLGEQWSSSITRCS